jgi:hypothetical protein
MSWPGFLMGFAGIVVLPVAIILRVDHNMKAEWEHRNLDPRAGRVLMRPNGSEWKECDGTTLVYRADASRSTGVAALANSPECAPKGGH